jgi:hypothetical protein
MILELYEFNPLSKEEMRNRIERMEGGDLNEFKNTGIYHSFRYNLTGQQQKAEPIEFVFDLIYQKST